jgi:hypothetical protein
MPGKKNGTKKSSKPADEALTQMAAQLAELCQQFAEAGGSRTDMVEIVQEACGEAEGVPPCKEMRFECAQGIPLGLLMATLHATCVVVSTPEHGPGPREGEFRTPVMSGLERLTHFLPSSVFCAYDYKGSASGEEMATKETASGANPTNWTDAESIMNSHWSAYWSGGVRKSLQLALLVAQGLMADLRIFGNPRMNAGNMFLEKGTRTVFPVSISGGPITKAEKAALCPIFTGVVADLCTRDVDVGVTNLRWLHFETFECYIKALQGYGGIDFVQLHQRSKFDLPGQWVDGDYNSEYDLLIDLPGATPEERRASLLEAYAPEQEVLDLRLYNATSCDSTVRVQQLLEFGANPNFRAPSNKGSMFWQAASRFNLEAMQTLLDAGADPAVPNKFGECPLYKVVKLTHPDKFNCVLDEDDSGDLNAKAKATIELCAQAELGKSFAEHVASLVPGAEVTWTSNTLKGNSKTGTIVEIQANGKLLVRGAKNANEKEFVPAQLRLKK